MTPLQVFLSVSGLILTVTFGLAVYLVPKHRVRQKFFDKALGNSGADGMPPHDDIFTILERVVHQLNGGGLGTKMTQIEGKTDDLSGDIRAVKEQVAEVQRFGFRLAQGQERLEAQVARVDGAVRNVQDKVDGRLFDLEEAERMHRAALHELGYPLITDETPD